MRSLKRTAERTLMVLVAVTAVVGLGWYLFWSTVPEISVDELLRQAERALEAEDEGAGGGGPDGVGPPDGAQPGAGPGTVGPAPGGVPGGLTGTPAEKPEPVTVAALQERYGRQAAALERRYGAALEILIEMGKEEYARLQSGQLDTSVPVLAGKYWRAGRALEARCDAEFGLLMKDLEWQLKANGLPVDIVRQAKVEYESRKEARRTGLLSVAEKYLGR